MKKIELGQTITILANIGVIAGIVFLALELQQNNRLLSAQAEYNMLQNRQTRVITQDAELAEFWFKVNSGAELNGVERLRVDAYIVDALQNWEWEYAQYQAGDLDRDDLPVTAWRNAFRGQGLRRLDRYPVVWESLKAGFDPEFVEFIEESVIKQVPGR